MDKRTIVLVIGFFLFISGMYAVVLTLVGAKVTFLLFLEKLGPSGGFFAKVAMIMIGIMMIVMSRMDLEEEEITMNDEL